MQLNRFQSGVEASFDQEALLREFSIDPQISATSGYRDQVFGESNTKIPSSEAEFKEFKPRLKYGWFHLKLYSNFQDLSQRLIETGFWQI